MSGKGSKPRPYSVDRETFESNWDAIFNKNSDPKPTPQPQPMTPVDSNAQQR